MIRVEVEPRLSGTPFGVAFLGVAFGCMLSAVPITTGLATAEWGPFWSWASAQGVWGVMAWLPWLVWAVLGWRSLRTIFTYVRVYVLFTVWVAGRPLSKVLLPALAIALVGLWTGVFLAKPALTHYAAQALSVVGPGAAMGVAAVWTVGWGAAIILGAPVDSVTAASAVMEVVRRSIQVSVADPSQVFGPGFRTGPPGPGEGQAADGDLHDGPTSR